MIHNKRGNSSFLKNFPKTFIGKLRFPNHKRNFIFYTKKAGNTTFPTLANTKQHFFTTHIET